MAISVAPYIKISRRGFLKGALIVGGALALAGCGRNQGESINADKEATPLAEYPYYRAAQVSSRAYIIPDYTRCTGCSICVVECSVQHFGVPDISRSNIKVYHYLFDGGRVDIPMLCMHCSDNPCLTACPPEVAAISLNESDRSLVIDNTKCIACLNCIAVCREQRSGCLSLTADGKGVQGACDYCGGEPQCYKYCPEGCLGLFRPYSADGVNWAQSSEEIAKKAFDMLYRSE